MFVSPTLVAAAKNLGSRGLAQSVMPGEQFTSPDAVVDLMAECTSPAAARGARMLLQKMSEGHWQVIRGAHRSAQDGNLHITIAVSSKRYHLRLDARSCIFDITFFANNERQTLDERNPWEAPGA
ncbi:MAG UNVERIFIED_CONTAM: hypothetical protein LVR18_22985 [Planctomycetaceae bacterium]|jgi:hypothetical protein